MAHPITDRIHEVKRTARTLATLRGFGLVVSVALATAFLLGSVDYLIRLEDPGTRVLLSVCWLATSAYAAWRWLYPVLYSTWSDQMVAQMIERRLPGLADKLSSSLAFLTAAEEHEAVGSKQLMRNVIAETTTVVQDIQLRDAIDWRPTKRSMAWLGGTVLVCLLVGLFHPTASSQAVTRLMTPWQENPWPRVHQLRFVDPPSRVSRGSDLQLRLVDDRSRLPARVDVQLWYDGEPESEAETLPMLRVDDAMVVQRTNVTRPFRYRATGGDDQRMKWTKLDVVDPPKIVAGTTRLLPPDYTGWLPLTLAQSLGPLRLLEGTAVTFAGQADRPLKAAILHFRGADSEVDIKAHVNQSRYRVPDEPQTWSVEASGEYSISLVDIDNTGTVDADRWNVRVFRDDSPRLSLTKPDSEELVTPNAVIPFECKAEDDLAIQRVELCYLRTDQSDQGEQSIVLFEGPATLTKVDMPTQLPAPMDHREVVYEWPLAPLTLAPGAVLSFHLLAEDYKHQVNQTLARRLVVVSDTELLDRVGRRQSLVLSRLQQRLEQQRQAKSQIDAVRRQVAEDAFDKPAMDRLQSGLIAQRQVNSALADDGAEVIQELRQLTGLLDRSRIGDVEVRSRIAKTLRSIEQLGSSHLEPALRHGTMAQQSLQAMRDQQQREIPADVPALLKTASEHQDEAVASIEALLDEMSAWDNYRKFAQELNELLRQQSGLWKTGQKIAQETLTRREDELDGRQRAVLRNAAAQQMDLARRMDRTLSNLSKGEGALTENDPSAAQMLRNALQAARDTAVSGRMRQAGQFIDQNKLGLAAQEQERAQQALEEMLDELSRRSYSREERSEKLDDVGRELQRLQTSQSQLGTEFQQANQERDPQRRRQLQRLVKRQQQVTREIHKLERQLLRLRADGTAQQMGQAASSTENAASAAQQGDGGQAQQQSQLAEAQLEQAQQSLQQAEQQAKSELAQEQMVRLPQLLDALISQQTSVVDEIARLDDLRKQQGELTRGQQTSVEIAAESQRTVAQSTDIVTEQMSELPAFVFALMEIRQTMDRVALALDERNISSGTHDSARAALASLELIREMLQQDEETRLDQQQPTGGDGDNSGGENPNSENIDARLAQLKLLREMQFLIQQETQRLNSLTATDDDLQQAADAELTRLADRQDKLAKLVSELVPPTSSERRSPLPKPEDAEQQPDLDALDKQLDLLLQ